MVPPFLRLAQLARLHQSAPIDVLHGHNLHTEQSAPTSVPGQELGSNTRWKCSVYTPKQLPTFPTPDGWQELLDKL